jgi:pimeloyl-ACP methyl ester carboxylesterase
MPTSPVTTSTTWTGQVTVDGARLAVRERGGDEPVVLLHTGFVADGMAPLFAEPALVAYRLVAHHRRGYGRSDRAVGPVTMADQAGDVLAVLAARGIDRAHLAGHSFAASARATPRALDGWLEAAFDPGWRDVLERDADAPFGVAAPSLQAWPRGPDDLRRIVQPALVVRGADGTWPGFRETQAALCSWLPRAEPLVVPDATHLLQIANPRGVAEGLAGFLGRHPLRAAA